MKKVFIVMIASGLLLTQACNDANNDSVDSAKEANDQKDSVSDKEAANMGAAAPVDEKDADFAVEAANGSMMEVEMGKVAQTKATNPRVKNFAEMLVNDHTKAGENLKSIAASKNITLPMTMGEDAQKKMADLNKKNGKDFDKAYMDMMLDDHKADVDKFKDAANDCKDADLKNFAMQTLPTLQMHLDSAKAITNKK